MKKTALIAIFLINLLTVSGQRTIDRLFEKYSGMDGYTSVTISGNLLNFAACFENDDHERNLEAKITEIRILAQKDNGFATENFYDLVKKDLNTSDYEELMRVKDSDQDLLMLVKTEGRKVKEFLLLAGGEDNAVIRIKGDMNMSDAKKLCEKAKKNHTLNLSEDK